MESTADFPPFQERLTSTLVQVTRTVGQLSAEDLNFHRTSSAEVSESLDEQSERLLSLTSSILKAATAGTDLPAPTLRDEDSVEDNWRGVVDVIDALLEKADACLDEFTGVIKKLSPTQQEQSAKAAAAAASRKAAAARFPSAYDFGPSKIPKPQLSFQRLPDNTDVSPFKPLLRTKPHAVVSLEESLEATEPAGVYKNPYEFEIRAAKYPESTYTVLPPVEYLPFESTTATFVDTLEGVKEMLSELKSAKEIAIDLEHHDMHSYHGLVSLMQISTRDKDWVVDTLKPWREDLQILNDVFADPAILKVLHGSSMDIIWLQRDLGLYVVGMFDTYHAACALNYPKRSLKFLLQKFVNFEADKRYQMADWRIRPLPSGMFDYARSDTHYLLYIYDHLRNELLENSTPDHSLIDYVSEQSKNEALQRYERPVYDAGTGQGQGGWYDYLYRTPAVLSKEQFAVFKAVHQWRDEVAREEDEGVQCVFPKHVLFKIAQSMPLDQGTLFRTLSPMTPIVRDRAATLLEVIKQAKIEGATGPEWRDVVRPKPTGTQATLAAGAEQGLMTPPSAEAGEFPTAARYEVSQFWGPVLDTQSPLTPPEYAAVASAEALRLSLPLPPMPRTVSEAREKLGDAAPAKPAAQPAAAPAPVPEDDSHKVFTVKELGGPRKRKAVPAATGERAPSLGLEDIKIDDSPSLEPLEKPTKKQRQKNKKNKSRSQSEGDAPEDTPFNYETADSVLHAQPAQAERSFVSRKHFSPYAKAMEAPAAARKQKREIAGKTFTFR
ncbi:exosome component 3'-5' exonuclease [Aspergillus clavatus NRRL 1]|uniref:Exosome complex exonuclease Rrp6, putative n=1 Tax=Aspergillus clavatus (strain ATCC 1007 / CBS 513.65 / DSM 816 / NCTC 3887 / NRRL 1 / QM 1276 / 107) TaxID=344612 RepID=A1CK88_ASPCL|nr:exosome component 3'-5' exonuclease [Aspergillus clavatus NRRL 1]EAW09562.1 exosome complex exonuclease Rrp6, putative [Aspergillus clavatus NRRL 1]